LTENKESIISMQTLRMMRNTIDNSSQYSDEELTSAGIIFGSLYATMQEVPAFLPVKEQVSFFTNLISCFVIGAMINSGIVNPHACPAYIRETANSMIDAESTQEDNSEAINTVTAKAIN
jgi:hypothetical protein